jgi:putative addiction module component (TIGR02574 family)
MILHSIHQTLTPAQRDELEHRLAAYDRDPDEGETWEAIRKEIAAELVVQRLSST